MVSPLLALLLLSAPAPDTDSPAPAVVMPFEAQLAAPQVVLEPRLERHPIRPPQSDALIAGVAISPTRVVVSLAALPKRLGNKRRFAPNPAVKAGVDATVSYANAALQWHWQVTGWDGVTRRGDFVSYDEALGIGVIELDQALPDPAPHWGPLDAVEHGEVSGLIAAPGHWTLAPVNTALVGSGGHDAFVTAHLPGTFDGAVVYADGRARGVVLGVRKTSASHVRSLAAIEHAMASAHGAPRIDLRWSVGIRIGRTFGPYRSTSTFGVNADLHLDRHWLLSSELMWQRFTDSRTAMETPYTLEDTTSNQWLVDVNAQYKLAPPASHHALAFVAGFGVHIDERTRDQVRLQAGPCAPDEVCPVTGIDAKHSTVIARPAAVLGLDLLSLWRGSGRNLVGLRVGYRLGLVLPSTDRSLHMLTVGLQI
jgi:hypothetical protein